MQHERPNSRGPLANPAENLPLLYPRFVLVGAWEPWKPTLAAGASFGMRDLGRLVLGV